MQTMIKSLARGAPGPKAGNMVKSLNNIASEQMWTLILKMLEGLMSLEAILKQTGVIPSQREPRSTTL